MRNCRRENHFDLDCAKNKNKISTNKESKLNKVCYFSFKNCLNFQYSDDQNSLKIIQPFINPSSCYITVEKFNRFFTQHL